MSNLVFIEKIFIDKKGIFSIKPQNEKFDLIYRSAMGVHWDSKNMSLYFVTPIKQENDIFNAYKQVILSVEEEYGRTLKIDSNTIFENISDKIKLLLVTNGTLEQSL